MGRSSWLVVVAVAGCTDPGDDIGTAAPDAATASADADAPPTTAYQTDPLAGLPTGAEQLAILCARGHDDDVSRAFCATSAGPTITSLVDLQRRLGLDPQRPPCNGDVCASASASFAITAHSSSLVARHVSPINPRLILFTPALPQGQGPNPRYVAVGFARGEQIVELVSKDPTVGEPRFYLLRFQQACNAAPGGCRHGDLLTPQVERNFASYTLYGEEDLANTVFDCLQCHQPNGPGSAKMLRQQELKAPWAHWMFTESATQQLGCQEFLRSHDGDDYAGVAAGLLAGDCRELNGRAGIDELDGPLGLERLLERNGFAGQPNEFDSRTILAEVDASNPAQPEQNTPPGSSPTWDELYRVYLAGNAIPPPYHDLRTTDDGKLAAMTDAYLAVRAGTLPRDQLPDIRDVLLADALPDMTMRPRPGATGRDILVQMCQQCHNSRLDQTLSRAAFNVERLSEMPRSELDAAIGRLRLPADHAERMPPIRFRELSPEEIELAVQALEP